MFLTAGGAGAGTGAGNEYEHVVNSAFDFHVAVPPDWLCAGCDSGEVRSQGSETEETWRLEAPERSTWLSAGFITGFPAESVAELKAKIEERHPGMNWSEIDRGGFLGFTSSAHGDNANSAMDYYLVGKHLVIRIEWQKEGSLPQRARQLDNVKSSINRVSTPPRILDIRSERTQPHQVGEEACLLVEVDDLKSAFEDSALSVLEIFGTPEHASFKTIRWIGASNWFRACFTVNSTFGADGLRVRKLVLRATDRDLVCEALEQDTSKIECKQGYSDEMPATVVPVHVAAIDNPTPDRAGPDILALDFDPQGLTLSIEAKDPSGLGVGRIETDHGIQMIFPDQVRNRLPISLGHIVGRGWNTVRSIVIFDANGMATMLRDPRRSTKRVQKASESDDTYEIANSNGTTVPSSLPVISFLHARASR